MGLPQQRWLFGDQSAQKHEQALFEFALKVITQVRKVLSSDHLGRRFCGVAERPEADQ